MKFRQTETVAVAAASFNNEYIDSPSAPVAAEQTRSCGPFGRGRRARRRVSSLWGELNIARPDRQARKSGAGRQPASSFVALAPAPWGHYKAGGAGDGAVGV